MFLLNEVGQWESSAMIEPLEPRTMLTAVPMMFDVAFARDAGNDRVLIVGQTDSGNQLVRLDADGSLDETFGDGGVVRLPLGEIGDVIVLGDGKVLISGNPDSDGPSAVYRLDVDGGLDESFGIGGKVLLPGLSWVLTPGDVAVDDDGGIAVAQVGRAVGRPDGTPYEYVLTRLTADGQLVDSFGDGGTVVEETPGSIMQVRSLVFTDSGGLVLAVLPAGGSFEQPTLLAFTADGALDESFGAGGVWTAATGRADSWQLLPGGALLVLGRQWGTGSFADLTMWRLGPDGELDPSFGVGGEVVLHQSGGIVPLMAPVFFPDGSVVIPFIDGIDDTSPRTLRVVALGPDGSVTSSFGDGGFVTLDDALMSRGWAVDCAPMADGGLVEVHFAGGDGTYPARMIVNRLGADGRPVAEFGAGGGHVVIGLGPEVPPEEPVDPPAPDDPEDSLGAGSGPDEVVDEPDPDQLFAYAFATRSLLSADADPVDGQAGGVLGLIPAKSLLGQLEEDAIFA